jgi:uncharacterized membrane protein
VTELLELAALLVTGAALTVAAVVLVTTRRPAIALPVLLEFLTAAGLIRLAAQPTWTRLFVAAGVVALRRLVVVGLEPAGRGRDRPA